MGLFKGLVIRRRKRAGQNGWFNLSKSGVSYSHKLGPLTLNTRGRGSVRLGRGISWRR